MKNSIIRFATMAIAAIGAVQASTVTVTVLDDGVSNIGANGTFYWALTNAAPGDTIAFNIPGAGPHFLQIPQDGFPLIYKKHNLTINGYSQPLSSPNSNPITGSNNAVIKIVIDGRSGGSRNMAYETYDGTAISDPPIDNTTMATERSGYGIDERALLGIYRSTNVTIRGIAFLGSDNPLAGGVVKGICFAHDYGLVTNAPNDFFSYLDSSAAFGHISGCWFGVNPTNVSVAGVVQSGIAITAYRHRDSSAANVRPELGNIGLTIGVAPGSANPRAEFNVIVGHAYGWDVEGCRSRVSGNFFGVMPDGVTPYNTTELQPAFFAGGQGEFGRYSDTVAMVIGTDGDGVNDADEGNIFGPLAPDGSPQNQFDFFSTARKPWIIAGNRFGIAGNGTIWTNSSFTIGSFGLDQGSQVRFGSDFNGVSDDLEANLIYNNNVFATLYPTPAGFPVPSQIRVVNNLAATDAWLSARGNKLVGCFPLYVPNSPTGFRYTNSMGNYILNPTDTTDVPGTAVPVLTASTITTLNGTCGVPNNSYTNLVVDVYLPDNESQVNGALFDIPFFGGAAGAGFVNGKTYLGSFLDNGPYDSNPAVGAFSFNISGLGLAHGTKVTATVTYSRFALPVITSVSHTGNSTTLAWSGNNGGPFNVVGQGGASSGFGVQSASSINGPWTTTFASGNSVVLPASGSSGYYRIVAPLSGMTTLGAAPVTLP